MGGAALAASVSAFANGTLGATAPEIGEVEDVASELPAESPVV